MSFYASFLSWWYSANAAPTTRVMLVSDTDLQAAIRGLTPVPQQPARAHSEPALFTEMRERRYQRNLRKFEQMVNEMRMA